MKIGVFDSGVGGLSVANAISKALPEHEVILRQDSKHVPYGTRELSEILSFVTPIFQDLVDNGCEIIVVACNTVSTNLISRLRDTYNVPLVAVEPMIKPAAKLTKTQAIAVCATPNTLSSERYKSLKNEFAKNITLFEPDCSDWSNMIENDEVDKNKIDELISEVLRQKVDVIVLACTHYHWIEDQIKELSKGKAIVLQPELAIIEQLKRVIKEVQSN